MMNLIMDQNAQLKQIKLELENMIKEKEAAVKTSKVPLEAVPLATIPIAQTSTTSTADGAEKLTKVVQKMSIQEEEIKKLQGKVKLLQLQKTGPKSFPLVILWAR